MSKFADDDTMTPTSVRGGNYIDNECCGLLFGGSGKSLPQTTFNLYDV